MFWIFNFNSRYYFAVRSETGGSLGDRTVTEQAQGVQEKGAAVRDGGELKPGFVPDDILLQDADRQNLREVDTQIAEADQIDEADQTLQDKSTGSPAEGSEADTADPADSADPDKEPKPSDEADTANPNQRFELSMVAAKGTMELLFEIVKSVKIYEFLQQLFKHNPKLVGWLGITIRGRKGIASHLQLRELVEEAQRVFVRNQKDLVKSLERMIRSLAFEGVLRSLNERRRDPVVAEELDSMVDAVVQAHADGMERLTTAIGTPAEGLKIQIKYAILIVSLVIAFFGPSATLNNRLSWTGSTVFAQDSLPPTGQPPKPTTGGGEQETSTPEPTATPEPTIQVTAVTATPDGITVTATIPLPPTGEPPRPTTGGGEQPTSTPTETPPPPTATATATATITIIIPSPTATATETTIPPTQTPVVTIIPPPPQPPTKTPTPTDVPPPPQPPTETPEQPPTETPPPTAIVLIETPEGKIEFEIPSTATPVLFDKPKKIGSSNTSGALAGPERGNSQLEPLVGVAMAAAVSLVISVGIVALRRRREPKKQ